MINGQTTTDALTTATSSTGTTGTTTTKPTTSSSSSTTTSGTTTTKPTTSSSTSSTTKSSTTKSPTTAVPTDSSDDTPATTTGASTSGTTKPSDSSVDSTEPEKVDCLPEVVGLSGAIPMKESTDYKPFPGCEVSIDNLDDAADGGKELRIDPCETCTKKYFCSALTVGSEVSFGTHQFMVRGTKSKYTSTKISLVSGSGVSAYEMFFMINNSTDLRMGYVYPNANSEQQQQVVRKTMTTDLTSYMTNYTIEWAENQVDFFVNNLLVHRVGYTRKTAPTTVPSGSTTTHSTRTGPTSRPVSVTSTTPKHTTVVRTASFSTSTRTRSSTLRETVALPRSSSSTSVSG
ncbi:hypothetical protein DFA_12213 [Cavenderia fasciculata]|uniref:GH16 domain-containing protein n=1 Tax=Cavenderia fasciculata TaxID=261658 RepID=F4QCL3_CACFS|nr:uncharacterized protein DFA_12213 [Cavenderia fasciculata]EGG14441.1 hypothetical protein DFA_12213 [Cavenderia fasciculata]|eukprot:XP_004353850.1 hypothetical protein DFA_12213 [Cavenderia fasciculata]